MYEARGHMEETAGLDVGRFGTPGTELEPRSPDRDIAENVARAMMVPARARARLARARMTVAARSRPQTDP